jgi:hypothetical protein
MITETEWKPAIMRAEADDFDARVYRCLSPDDHGCCGNGMCEMRENVTSCPEDECADFECASTTDKGCCGNGICEDREWAATCPADCFGDARPRMQIVDCDMPRGIHHRKRVLRAPKSSNPNDKVRQRLVWQQRPLLPQGRESESSEDTSADEGTDFDEEGGASGAATDQGRGGHAELGVLKWTARAEEMLYAELDRLQYPSVCSGLSGRRDSYEPLTRVAGAREVIGAGALVAHEAWPILGLTAAFIPFGRQLRAGLATERTVVGADFMETPFNRGLLYMPERYETPRHDPSEALNTKDAYLLSESPFKGCPPGSRHFHCFYDLSSCAISSASYWKHDLSYYYYDHTSANTSSPENKARVLHDVGLVGLRSQPAAPIQTVWGWPVPLWARIVNEKAVKLANANIHCSEQRSRRACDRLREAGCSWSADKCDGRERKAWLPKRDDPRALLMMEVLLTKWAMVPLPHVMEIVDREVKRWKFDRNVPVVVMHFRRTDKDRSVVIA